MYMTCGCSFRYFYMYINACLRGAPPQVPALSIPQTGTGHDNWRVFVFISSCCECCFVVLILEFLFEKSMQKYVLLVIMDHGLLMCITSWSCFSFAFIQCVALRGAPPQVPTLSIPQTGTGHDSDVCLCVCVFVIMLKVLFCFVDSGISVWKVYAE